MTRFSSLAYSEDKLQYRVYNLQILTVPIFLLRITEDEKYSYVPYSGTVFVQNCPSVCWDSSLNAVP
jgi:hypothetical protein